MLESYLKVMETVKKMGPFSVFLLCCFAVATQGCDQYAATGEDIIVPVDYTVKSGYTLRWKFEETLIIHRRNKSLILVEKGDINADGSLKLINLKKKDSGVYTTEVHDQRGKIQAKKSVKLCVLDRVKKPSINVTCKDSDVTFTCIPQNIQKPDDAQYKWFQNGNQINETGINLKKKTVEMKKVQFSCEVYNKISSERSDPVVNMCFEPVRKPEINTTCKSSEVIFTCNAAQQADDAQYKWFQSGEVIHNEIKISLIRTISESKNMNFSCEVYNDGSSEKSFSLSHTCVYNILPGIPDELFGISTWVFIAGGGGFLLVLIIIIVCCCVICKKKKKLRENDEEELEYRRAKRSTSSYCSP